MGDWLYMQNRDDGISENLVGGWGSTIESLFD